MTEGHYHDPQDRRFAQQLRKLAPTEFAAYRNFADTAVGREDGQIPPRYRELIAIAAALGTQCVYCLESHTKNAAKLGVTAEEIAEVVYITAALKAGSVGAHGMMTMKLYQRAQDQLATD